MKNYTAFSILACVFMAALVSAIHLKHEDSVDQLRSQIDEAFRKANEIGAIHRLYVTETLHGEDQNIKMEYYYMPGYAEKEKETQKQKESGGKINPFIDIEKGLFIRNFESTHSLVFNKYNLFDKHLLLISQKYQPQIDLLDSLDFKYACQVRQALQGVILFNGGKNSGSSQNHKHIQIVPSEAKLLPIYEEIADYTKGLADDGQSLNIFTYPHFHFLHGIISFGPSSESLDKRLYKAYNLLHRNVIAMNKQRYQDISDYNFIGSDSFAMLVPRSQEKAQSTISINSIGFLGALLFKEKTYMQRFYREHTPSEILAQITFP